MSTTLKDKYINFFTDYGFKRLFGEERNKDLLIDFLNALLAGKENIAVLNYKKTEHLGSSQVDRKAIFDLYCENEKGEKFIIELQKAKQNFFKERSIFYSTFPIQEQAQRGEWDFKLKGVYTIGILDFTFNDQDKEKTVVNEVKLLDTKSHEVFYDKLTYIYLQMPNFNKSADELENQFEKWLFAIKNLQNLDDKPEILSGVFEKFFSEAEIANYSVKEIRAYENSLKYYRDLKNTLDTARDEGWKKGKEEGREEGRKEGIKEGELRIQIKTALHLLKKEMDDDFVRETTGLSKNVISKVRLLFERNGEISIEEILSGLE